MAAINHIVLNFFMLKLNLYRIKRFILSGGSATALHFTVMGLLIYWEVDPLWATSTGAVAGALFNYILQYYYTFRSDRQHSHSILAYLFAAVLAWLTNLAVFALLHNMLGAGIIIAQLGATLIVTIQNYVVYKKLVFLQNTSMMENHT